MTKSGPKFNTVLERFKEISLPEIAAPYAGLRQKVIGAKLEVFRNQRDSLLSDYSVSLLDTYYPSGYQIGSDLALA